MGGFEDYTDFMKVVFTAVFVITVVTTVTSSIFDKFQNRYLPSESMQILKLADTDSKYALEVIGDDSVYQFFLGTSWLAWFIATATMTSQLWMNFLFVEASEVDLSADRSDLAYTWKCPRDNYECNNTADLTYQGWVAFAILMATHVLKDIINGMKLVVLSGKRRNDTQTRLRFFIGGTLLAALSLFTFYTSVIYNTAIATSDTDIIMNSVVILFICDIDELFFDILLAINPDWVERSSYQSPEESSDKMDKDNKDNETRRTNETSIKDLQEQVQTLNWNVKMLHKNVEMLTEQLKSKKEGKQKRKRQKIRVSHTCATLMTDKSIKFKDNQEETPVTAKLDAVDKHRAGRDLLRRNSVPGNVFSTTDDDAGSPERTIGARRVSFVAGPQQKNIIRSSSDKNMIV